MSEFYAEGNNEGSKNLFYKRSFYDQNLSQTGYPNVVNFNFGEKLLYGRVNRNYIPMTYDSTYIKLKRFNKAITQDTGLSAISFVVDAFKAMAQQFDKCTMTGKIDTTDPFLSSLTVYKAYQNPSVLYRNHNKSYFDTINGIFKRDGTKVKNFDEFLTNFMYILENTAPRTPFTKPGFIKSRRCPINCSGLVIEIADLDVTNDQEKIDQFVNSNNWQFYLNACASYGFMVDRDIPWRIVADIGDSPARSAMIDYASEYGLKTTRNILLVAYNTTHAEYYKAFKYDLLNIYNNVKLKNFVVYEDCNGHMIPKVFYPTTYTPTSFFKNYSEEDFLKIYFKIRFFEEESQFTDNEQSLMIDDCIEIYLKDGKVENAIGSFERILNKPFDYRGSLSYIKGQMMAVADAAIAEESLSQGY